MRHTREPGAPAGPEPPPFRFGAGMRWVRRLFLLSGLLTAVWLVVWLGFGGRADFVAGEPYEASVMLGAWIGLSAVAIALVAGVLLAQQLVMAILTRLDEGPLFSGFLGRGGQRRRRR
ncbi:hypothetical protein [Zhihengliuella flava]|uniref:Cell division protein FtsX n=1 Tax=Zhihengliuella flava TaxID=1285193 RepID=A0A931DBB6_9MICC|nr:hypothetical protein [Zhihengliuella flava]MBG6085749.1 cell division protein FtsX [Zhihengliuella flava]